MFLWEKTVPANRDPGSSIPRSRFAGQFFSHINAILFSEICVDEISANRGPRFSRAKTGTVFLI